MVPLEVVPALGERVLGPLIFSPAFRGEHACTLYLRNNLTSLQPIRPTREHESVTYLWTHLVVLRMKYGIVSYGTLEVQVNSESSGGQMLEFETCVCFE